MPSSSIRVLGGVQIKTGGGAIQGPPVVLTAGSADSVLTFYDGTGTGGVPISICGVGTQGPLQGVPNYSFGAGLYAEMTGTTPAVAQVVYQ